MSEESQERIAEQLKLWEADEVAAFTSRQPERLDSFSTNGGIPVKRVYTPLDVPGVRTRRCIAGATGRCGRLPASAPARTRTAGSST